jgi:predicted glycoside hydrolase/deacetylase ChbG (UPF0249 family)
MMTDPAPIDLIINADDYGYYPCVSQGILEAAKSGAITATGILANSPDLKTQLEWLHSVENLDLGVHLNLTSKRPLTSQLEDKLSAWDGCFPGTYTISYLLLTQRLTIQDIRLEWSAQIEACQGYKPVFLNSHEHIHMLPLLFPLALELAQTYNITNVRLTQADWITPFNGSTLLRNTLMQGMHAINRWQIKQMNPPLFLGFCHSGKLNYDYLAKIFSSLKSGNRYELMCHPGHFDPAQISDPKLLCYHDWTAELALLQNPKLHELYEQFGIRLVHY